MNNFDPSLARLLQNPAQTLRELDRLDCEQSLRFFVKRHWGVLEPHTPFVDGWALGAICEHLQAVTDGEITRLLMNVPPGFMKSMLCNVFWPAWEWGPKRMAYNRFVNFSYASSLTERDNAKFRDLIQSRDYQSLWSDRFALNEVGKIKVSNDKTGSKLATSIGGVGTGERGDRVVLDDPHNVREGESDAIRNSTVTWFREAMSNRLNNMEKSAIVVIMQRVHDTDVSGAIVSDMSDEYTHLMIPMELDNRYCTTSIGWTDPRDTEGELAWPERFPPQVVSNLKNTVGPYAYSSQYQQMPAPRGGGIFRDEWWQLWGNPDDDNDPRYKSFPTFDYVIASLDAAYTEKEENDYSAMVVLGSWKDDYGLSKLMLVHAWRDRLPINELVERSAYTCRKFKVDDLLIESKASGISAAQEMKRLHAGGGWGVKLVNPGRIDKTNRAYAVQHIFADEMVYAPDKEWADMVRTEMKSFPKAPHDDLTDAVVQGVRYLRDNGLLMHGSELAEDLASALAYKPTNVRKLYPGTR